MIHELKLIYTNLKINYLRHHWNFKNWRWYQYILGPQFEIYIDQHYHNTLSETNYLLDQINKALANLPPVEKNTTTKFEFIMGADGLEPPTNGL